MRGSLMRACAFAEAVGTPTAAIKAATARPLNRRLPALLSFTPRL
jgi:hypothetical protein